MLVAAGGAYVDGPVWLNSGLSIDTSLGSGDITLSPNTTIDSQNGEQNNLRLNAGMGNVSFAANIGVAGPGDTRIGFLRVESSGMIDIACNQVQAAGEIVLVSSGDVTIHEVAPGMSTLVGYSFTVEAGGTLWIEDGAAVASSTGQVSNAPPIFQPVPDDPNKVLVPGDRVQTITGTIGYDPSNPDPLNSNNLERAVNLTLTIFWSDGLITTIHGIHAGDDVQIFVDEAAVPSP